MYTSPTRLSQYHQAAETRPLRLESGDQLQPVESTNLGLGSSLRADWFDAAQDEAARHAVSLTTQPEVDLFGGLFGPYMAEGLYDTAIVAFYG